MFKFRSGDPTAPSLAIIAIALLASCSPGGDGGSGGTPGLTGGSGGASGGTGPAPGTGGVSGGSGGSVGSGGASGGAGPGPGMGGASGGAGDSGGSAGSTGGTQGACGAVNHRPFDCTFAWGAPNDDDRASYLDFVSAWVGYEDRGGLDGALSTNERCDGCGLAGDLAGGNAMAVFYAYFIGYQANLMGGFGDCNVDYDGHNLCTDGAQWIRDNRASIVKMYGEYARKVNQASPSKPVIWWLEGDFVQYTYEDQSNPLSMAELGGLARDITCAIKANQPNAVVAMNHSPWISDEQANAFWSAMPTDALDLVWVQGPGDSGTLTNSGDYNAATANYAWLSGKTGLTIMAETSFAGDGVNDRFSTASASEINQRIAEGVIGVLVNNPGAGYRSSVQGLTPELASTCR